MKPSPTITKQKKCQLYIYLPEDLKAFCVEQAAQYNPPLSVSQWMRLQLETIRDCPVAVIKRVKPLPFRRNIKDRRK